MLAIYTFNCMITLFALFVPICYNLMTLELIKERNLVLGLTQENSMESLYNISIFIY